MQELVVAGALSVAVGVGWALVVRAMPHADPARAAARKIDTAVRRRSDRRAFLRARLDPESTTGLVLTVALVAVIVAGVVLGVFVAMIRTQSGVVNLDRALTRWAASGASPLSLTAFGAITWAGSTIVVVAIAVATALYAYRRWGNPSVGLFFVVVVAGQFLLSNTVKVVVARVRPNESPFHLVQGPSFPSGHATAAAATWAAVALVLGRGTSVRVRAILAGTAAGIAVAVACSRVCLGAHWSSDVVGGLLLGWAWFAVCAVAFGGRVLRLGEPIPEIRTDGATTGESHDNPAGPPQEAPAAAGPSDVTGAARRV